MKSQRIEHNQVQWGCMTLLLDDEEFRHGFASGRACYFADIHQDYPERARTMRACEATEMLLVEDAAGRLHFDAQELDCPLDTLGFFLGYMSGPIIPETPEEQQARLKEEAEMIVLEVPVEPQAMPAR
jgi:hypothetical protein